MKNINYRKFSYAIGCIILSITSLSMSQTKIACVGTSITQFYQYPEKLQALLGSSYTVGNFGESGATALMKTNRPYMLSGQISKIVAFKPGTLVIELGANDNVHDPNGLDFWKDSVNFIRDYTAIIDTISNKLGYKPRIFLCLPTAQTTTADGRTDATIHYGIIPRIKQIAIERGLPTIDLYTPFADPSLHLLSNDGLHPAWNVGPDTIAHLVYRAIKATTMITSPKAHNSKAMVSVRYMQHGEVHVTLPDKGRHTVSVMTAAGRILSSATVEGTTAYTLRNQVCAFGLTIVSVDSYAIGLVGGR